MVDLQGKFYLIDELDANFVKACVDNEKYGHHAGDYVKNAYDPQFNQDGVWDKKASDKAEDLNVVLCYELKLEGKAFKTEKHVHNYPHCWRTDKPILYYPLDSWFIKDTARKERMVELNKTINWQPESTGTGTSHAHASGAPRFLSGAMITVARSASVRSKNCMPR